MVKAAVILGLLGIFVFSFFCFSYHSEALQNDLRTRSFEALNQAGFNVDDILFRGRDAILTGQNPEALDKAAEIVDRVFGVRSAATRIMSKPAAERPWLTLYLQDRKIELAGLLRTELIKTELIGLVRNLLKGITVSDRIDIDEKTEEPDWLAGVATVLPSLKQGIHTGVVKIAQGIIELNGEVANTDIKDRLASEAATAFSGLSVVNNLRVMSGKQIPKLPEITSSLEEIQKLLDPLTIYFDTNSNDYTDDPNYLQKMTTLLGIMNQYDYLSLRIAGHADSRGAEAHNQNLSERRSHAVFWYLRNKYKVEGSRLQQIGHGENYPKINNPNDVEMQQNRRVKFETVGLITSK